MRDDASPVDLAIVGAGIVGLSAAFWARRVHPEWSIVVLERSLVGSGSTQHSAALCTPLVRTSAYGAIAARSLEAYDAMAEVVSLARPRTLPLLLVTSLPQIAALAACVQRSTEALEAARVSGPGLPGHLMLGADERAFGGFTAASRDARRLPDELARHLTGRAGVRCWDGVQVDSVERGDQAFDLQFADGRQLRAARVIAATGPWLRGGPGAELAERAGIRIKKVVALHIEGTPPPDAAMCYLFDHGAFLAPIHHEGRWLLSFTSHDWDVAPEPTRLAVSDADRRGGLALVERYFPSLAAMCSGARVFCDAYTPSGIPLVARVPGPGDFVVAGAASGAGIRLGPGMAVTAVEALVLRQGDAT